MPKGVYERKARTKARKKSGPGPEPWIQCGDCGMKFRNPQGLRMHRVRKHGKVKLGDPSVGKTALVLGKFFKPPEQGIPGVISSLKKERDRIIDEVLKLEELQENINRALEALEQ